MPVAKYNAGEFGHGVAIVKADGGLVVAFVIGPRDQRRHLPLGEELIEIRAAVVADQKQGVGAPGNQRADLLILELLVIGRRRHEERFPVAHKLLLEGLKAPREDGVFHGGNDCAHGVGLLGGEGTRVEIGRIAELLHGLHHTLSRVAHDLVRIVQAARNSRRRNLRAKGDIRQGGDRVI